MLDTKDASAAFEEVKECREAFPNHYVKVNAYNAQHTNQTTALSFIVNRPNVEPGFRLNRTESNDRHILCTLHPYSSDDAHGTRYQKHDGPEPD
jgi:ribulose-bisphosphate carboxylase small chain